MLSLRSFLTFTTSILLCSGIFAQIDTSPKPYGGNSIMKEFMCNEMTYPPAALNDKIEGTVEVAITVMQDGKTLNHRIYQSISPQLDQEALRICKLLLFYPAVKNGNYIIDDVKIPVRFNVKKYKRNCKNKGFDDFEQYSGPVDTSLNIYPVKALDRAPVPVFSDPGMDFGKYIGKNLKYPELAFTQSISGKVVLNFIVETSGRISNIEIADPLGGGCSEEAIKLLNQLHWSPGMLKGKAVRTSLSASISFSLENDSNHQYLPNNNNSTM